MTSVHNLKKIMDLAFFYCPKLETKSDDWMFRTIDRKENIMDFSEFKEIFTADLGQRLYDMGFETKVANHSVDKLNESYEAVTVTPEGSNIGINLNISRIYEAIENGEEYDAALSKAVATIEKGMDETPDINVTALTDYSQMKERLVMEARADLGVRVQTSGLSDTTFSEAVTNIEIEKIVLLGETIDIGCLKKSGVVEKLEREIRAINRMKEDYEDLTDVINGLDDTEEQLLMEYFVENKCIQELADERQLSYKGIYKQLNIVRNKVKVEMMKSFEIYSREVSA